MEDYSDETYSGVTVGQLIEHLSIFSKDDHIIMGGLKFYRTKSRGPGILQIEFEQQVYRNGDGKIVVEE
jgi:hypothetical protein